MFIATNNVLRYANLSDFHGHTTSIPVGNVTTFAAIDYDPLEGYIYWGDTNLEIISRARLNGTDETILISNVHPLSLALDVESQMIYWTDINNTIRRSNMNGSNEETLIADSLSEPDSLVLDTRNGKMYWAETAVFIQRANLNGTGTEKLVKEQHANIIVLALDLQERRIFWATSDTAIKFCDMDGQNCGAINDDNFFPIAMAVYGNYVYLLDEYSYYKLARFNISNGDEEILFTRRAWSFYGITSGTTDEGKDIVLISEHSGIVELDVSMEGDLGKGIGLVSTYRTTGVAFDSKDDRIYFIDYSNGDIITVFRNNSGLKLLIQGTGEVSSMRNLALSLKTNEIFWTNNVENCISMATLPEGNKTGINITANNPVGIALDVENRVIYWTEHSSSGEIKRSSYTGDEKETLVSQLNYPYAISLDIAKKQMYWTQDDNMISMAFLNGTEVVTRQVPYAKNQAMTIIGQFIYWYSDVNEILYRVDRFSNEEASIVLSKEENHFIDLKIITHIQECISTPCQNNGTCIDFINGYNCTCPDGFTDDQCQTEIEECIGTPCQNNGTCIDFINGYNCTCPIGFTGDQCQTDIDDCNGISCQNNGTCIDEFNAYHCSCSVGFVGNFCEIAISYCSGVICQNNGVCVADVAGYHCLCMSGFVGDHCETGLGFVIFIIGGFILMTFGICMSRGAAIQRKINEKKRKDSTPAKLFSLVHLPTTGNDILYMPNNRTLTEISEIQHPFDE